MPCPYTTTSIADALAYAHQRAYAAGAQAVILLDSIRAELLVLVGPHEEFLAGRHVVCTLPAKPWQPARSREERKPQTDRGAPKVRPCRQ